MQLSKFQKTVSRRFLSAAFVSMLCLSGTAFADDCGTTLAPIFDWFNNHVGSVPFKMATNRIDSRYVSYTNGSLRQRQFFPFDLFTSASSQTFSDRWEPPCGGGFAYQNFYVNNADSLGLSVDWSGDVSIHNNTWGGDVGFQGTCFGSMIYGTINDDTMAVISFGTPVDDPR